MLRDLPEVRKSILSVTKIRHANCAVMATQERSFFSPWTRGSDYNPSAVDADLLRLQKFYFDRGYLDVRAAVAKVEGNDAGNAVQLHITIEEGEITMVREVVVRVKGPMPPGSPSADTLKNDLPLRADEPITRQLRSSRDQLLLRCSEWAFPCQSSARTRGDREGTRSL